MLCPSWHCRQVDKERVQDFFISPALAWQAYDIQSELDAARRAGCSTAKGKTSACKLVSRKENMENTVSPASWVFWALCVYWNTRRIEVPIKRARSCQLPWSPKSTTEQANCMIIVYFQDETASIRLYLCHRHLVCHARCLQQRCK